MKSVGVWMRLALASLVLAGSASSPQAGLIGSPQAAEPPKFTKKPVVEKKGQGAVITFAVDRATDVAVFIEDGQGRIIRHLVAGVLGKNPPAPLKAGSLEQTLEWDGLADYGKPLSSAASGGGGLKVRVALGLSPRYDRVLASDLQNIGGIKGLGVGPDGTVYLTCQYGPSVANWTGEWMVSLDRRGQYLRTVLPYSSALKKAEVEGHGVFDLAGRPAPLLKAVYDRGFFASLSPNRTGLAVTRDGVVLRVLDCRNWHGYFSIGACGAKGETPWGKDDGPPLFKGTRKGHNGTTRAFLCVSGDGEHAYVSGLGDTTVRKPPYAGVHRVKLPDRGPAEPFFGTPYEAGKDRTHLGLEPRGLAADGKGHLLIADHANDRVVVVNEADGKYVAEMAVDKPDGLGVDPATGAVYVTSLKDNLTLLKFDGWKEGKVLARLSAPLEDGSKTPPVMALDAAAKPPIVWIARGASLTRVEDKGASFEGQKVIDLTKGQFGSLAFDGMEVDRFQDDKEVYVRSAHGSWGGNGTFYRFSEKTGKWTTLTFPGAGGVRGSVVVPGADGAVYAPGYSSYLYRYDRDGKPTPWATSDRGVPKDLAAEKLANRPPNAIWLPVGMTYTTHTVGVRPSDGHIFAFDALLPGARTDKALYEILPSGERVKGDPVVWKVSDVAVGPRFDAQGNIYVAEQIKPLGQVVPDELKEVVGPMEVGKQHPSTLAAVYGSIVKFGPKGGMIHFANKKGRPEPFQGAPKLDPSLKTVDAAYYSGSSQSLQPLKVTGAEWIGMGISHVEREYCNCESVRFDVDEFGRTWYPDLACFRVGVLDTQGNVITRFGGYGNADSCGPESKDKALAEPELAFAYLISVGATDRYAYMGDSLNRRVLRAKLVYAAEESVEVK